MKPVSSRSVDAALIASREAMTCSSASGSGCLLTIAFLKDALVLAHSQLQLLVPQQGQVDANAAQRRRVELGADQRLLEVGRFGQAFAIGPDDLGATPEVDAILVAHAVAEDHEAGEELRVHAVQHLNGVGAAQGAIARHHAATGAAVDAD